MITDKFCFIHLRNQQPDGNYNVTGGATIAWVVDSVTGDILIGHPARCIAQNLKQGIEGDIFQKAVGRKVAQDNLVFHDPLFVVKRDTLVWLATQQAVASVQFPALSPDAITELSNFLANRIEDSVVDFMNSNWYEQVVRSHFVLNSDNSLDVADEALSPANAHLEF